MKYQKILYYDTSLNISRKFYIYTNKQHSHTQFTNTSKYTGDTKKNQKKVPFRVFPYLRKDFILIH